MPRCSQARPWTEKEDPQVFCWVKRCSSSFSFLLTLRFEKKTASGIEGDNICCRCWQAASECHYYSSSNGSVHVPAIKHCVLLIKARLWLLTEATKENKLTWNVKIHVGRRGESNEERRGRETVWIGFVMESVSWRMRWNSTEKFSFSPVDCCRRVPSYQPQSHYFPS